MAASSPTFLVLATNTIPRNLSQGKSELYEIKKRDLPKRIPISIFLRTGPGSGRKGSTRLLAGLSEVEPDLNEDPKDQWRTNGIDAVLLMFVYCILYCSLVIFKIFSYL